jgi:hypothetical protein
MSEHKHEAHELATIPWRFRRLMIKQGRYDRHLLIKRRVQMSMLPGTKDNLYCFDTSATGSAFSALIQFPGEE